MGLRGDMGGVAMLRRRAQVVVASTVAAGAVVALFAASSARSVVIPEQGPWLVLVAADPVHFPQCLEDDVIAMTTMTASAPSTGVSLKLTDDATRSEVNRLVRCLTDRVSPALVEVGTDTGRVWPLREGATTPESA